MERKMTLARAENAAGKVGRADGVATMLPLLTEMFGAKTTDDLPPLVQQGLSVLEPALKKYQVISSVEIEQSVVRQFDRHHQFEDCAAAGFVAIALLCQMEHVPASVRGEINSLLELILTKLEQKLG